MRPDILTCTGHYFDFMHPECSVLTIEDIAHSLSNICRFTGHCREFYSVAQHSVYVSYLLSPEHAFAGLMHDAAEAVLGDVSSPLKKMLPEYKAIEKRVEATIFFQFGLSAELPPEVKHADLVMLATEKRDLMWQRPGAMCVLIDPATGDPHLVPAATGSNAWGVTQGIEPAPLPIRPVGPAEAREMFLARYRALSKARYA